MKAPWISLLLLGSSLSLLSFACAAEAAEEEVEGSDSAINEGANSDARSDFRANARDLAWLIEGSTRAGYLYPGSDIMEDSYRPGGWAAFAPDKNAELAVGTAASMKLPPRSAFAYDRLGVSGTVLTHKPMRFTFCAVNAAKRGVCQESAKGDGRGASVILSFVPADDITYIVLVRGRVVGDRIERYAGDVDEGEGWLGDAFWRMDKKPTDFPTPPMTPFGW